ncbi:uncharacterized protein MKK02DRAFT_37521 [Dioszegia hungarica]|uniref:Uncharacterized protein n=1 Tax=Dioszegia hungarica TaxID=4972 RepID=A0AA38H6C1_9TREE|nr:uncharacterized protein MKK02DRAFT_37521 [Dioszegia hungarica]KAI9634642.1 hypothetical protein MKK02DRAFT_37521 [Dioszegia hungarica]
MLRLPSSILPYAPSYATESAGLTTSKEAYVLFLPSVTHEEYLLGVRVLLFGYKYDHDTRDPSRDVVVMTTPQVPLEVEELLRSEGAIISRNDLITSIPMLGDTYLDAGFLLVRPDRKKFEELLLVRDFAGLLGDMEQALLNKYFRKDGPHPWTTLRRPWVKAAPDKTDLMAPNPPMLHGMCWAEECDWELRSLWHKKLGKMLGFHAARRQKEEEGQRDL